MNIVKGEALLMDTSSVIALAEEGGRPDLIRSLDQMGHEIHIPPKVVQELKKSNTTVLKLLVAGSKVLHLTGGAVFAKLSKRYPQLGKGELAVLAQGTKMKGQGDPYRCVLDDKQARKVAASLRLEYTGTVGLLLRLEQGPDLDRAGASALLETMRQNGFRYAGRYPP